jgi:Putative porin
MSIVRKILAAVVLFSLCASLHAQNQDEARRELETLRQTTVKMIETMVQSGIITKERAEELLREARREADKALSPGQTAADKEKVIRVPYVPQIVRDEIKEEIRQEVVEQAKKERWGEPGALPEWLRHISFHGDFRLRYQSNRFEPTNGPFLNVQDTNAGGGLVLLNTTQNFDLWRIRLRLGIDAQLSDGVRAGLRLSTGSVSNPVSDNQTLGNTFNRNTFGLDRAYVRLDPYPWFSFTGGRIANPFFSSDLVWDEDLNFEGVATTLRPGLARGMGLSLTLGAFPLEKFDCANATQVPDCTKNKWIYGIQAATDKSFSNGKRMKFGLALYDFKNIAGTFNDPVIDPANRSAIPKFVQKGNTVFDVRTDNGNSLLGLASEFRELSFTVFYDVAQFSSGSVSLLLDAVKNIGYDREEIRLRTGGLIDQKPRTLGYQVRLAVGREKVEKQGDWLISGGYKYLERDAVVDGFTESDFHLGGTDAKGWILGASYGVAANTWLRARWLSANEIDGPPLAIDVLQIDLNAKF